MSADLLNTIIAAARALQGQLLQSIAEAILGQCYIRDDVDKLRVACDNPRGLLLALLERSCVYGLDEYIMPLLNEWFKDGIPTIETVQYIDIYITQLVLNYLLYTNNEMFFTLYRNVEHFTPNITYVITGPPNGNDGLEDDVFSLPVCNLSVEMLEGVCEVSTIYIMPVYKFMFDAGHVDACNFIMHLYDRSERTMVTTDLAYDLSHALNAGYVELADYISQIIQNREGLDIQQYKRRRVC